MDRTSLIVALILAVLSSSAAPQNPAFGDSLRRGRHSPPRAAGRILLAGGDDDDPLPENPDAKSVQSMMDAVTSGLQRVEDLVENEAARMVQKQVRSDFRTLRCFFLHKILCLFRFCSWDPTPTAPLPLAPPPPLHFAETGFVGGCVLEGEWLGRIRAGDGRVRGLEDLSIYLSIYLSFKKYFSNSSVNPYLPSFLPSFSLTHSLTHSLTC